MSIKKVNGVYSDFMLTLIIIVSDESKPVRHDAKICTVASFLSI